MRSFIKKGFSAVLLLSLFIQLLCGSAFAAETKGEEPVYKNFVIFGDSICLGFSTKSASMADGTTYDIERNLLRAVLSEDYKHCYPTQFAARLGLKPFEDISYPDGVWNYQEEVDWDDVYNYGICAAWSGDIKELLTNPYYLYQYASANYDKNSTFELPDDYTGMRFPVNQDAEGHNDADMSTWEYTGDFSTMEEYTLPKGTSIPVAYEYEYWGFTYLMPNPIVSEKYFYVSEKCLDSNGGFINDEPVFYPTTLISSEYGDMYLPDTETYGALLGNPIQNPEFTKYYYDLTTTTVKNGDLIALAAGNNDIYHSFMPYQQSSDSLLCNLIYFITYALQMDYSVGDIMSVLNDPEMLALIFGGGLLPAEEESIPSDPEGMESPGVPESDNSLDLSGLISAEEIGALLELYSSENVTAYLADTVEEYKVNYEATIQRILELKPDHAELILVGHYNPFGMINYLTMLSEAMQNGQLYEHLSQDAELLYTLLQSIIGTPEQWEEINSMDEEELAAYAETADAQMADFLSALQEIDLDDPEVDDALTQLLTDLSFPLSVLLVGNALSDTYSNMNDFLQEMAEKYDLVYVDVSDAPSSGRYDPHPTAYGHKWIADRLYETVVPEITANVSVASSGEGVLTPLGNREFRLRDSQTYRFLAADGSKLSSIFVDGELLSEDEFSSVYANGSYTFEKIMASHTLTLQFDKDADNTPKYAVNVLGSYAKYGAGEGMYEAGKNVTINAGALDGFEFTGWLADGVELEDTDSIITSFKMPANEVTVTATWKVVEDEPTPDTPDTPHYIIIDNRKTMYDLKFETNGGTTIPPYTKKSGTVIDLNTFFTTREGFIFTGWYSDAALTNKITSIKMDGNKTVYAGWESEESHTSVHDCPSEHLEDVDRDAWYHEYVDYVVEKGLMQGVADNRFAPYFTTTRAMIVTILYRLEGKPSVSGTSPFDDVAGGQWYTDAVIWANQNNIVEGYGNGKFGPMDNITREQMATVLYRYANVKGYDTSVGQDTNILSYSDAFDISDWAMEAMQWACGEGLIKGRTESAIVPAGRAIRAEAATILIRFIKNIK